ncbi:MAG: thymidine kinase [Clostridia bacterium]|nr:thymidine kinase [Clostridia bacterium]
MAKLYFKYGAVGSSKTAQALMTKFNYEQKNHKVLLIKSNIDNRDMENGKIIVKSRIGLCSSCETFDKTENLFNFVKSRGYLGEKCVVIVDEAQFCTAKQIDELHMVSQYVPVLCYGLLTNFKTQLFEGSKRLVEVAESLMEIKSICDCGKKATINARFVNGKLETDGDEIVIGDTTYKGICYGCYQKLKEK